ncbi:DNA -binding domain-containing protein [Sphingomonas sp.]|jgi:hypothetical protein|uniref:DNA -binding domain-containing protein n=1 Tax=Sphingomonas sp. TaxID=28214 RepID=UPI00356A6771
MPGDRDAFDLLALPGPATHLSLAGAGEHLLLGRGPRTIRLSIARGTLLDGPVRLAYQLAGTDRLELRLLALRRLAAFLRHGRLPASLFPGSGRTKRWTELLRALDALATSSSHRAVAEAVFGDMLVRRAVPACRPGLGRADRVGGATTSGSPQRRASPWPPCRGHTQPTN